MTGLVHEKRRSSTVEWYTPKWLFDCLGVHFDTDVASPGADVVPWVPATNHITKTENGLTTEWTGRVWMNHPYGKDDAEWAARFVRHENGIGIVHARTDTAFVKYIMENCDVMFTSRIKFVDASGSPPKRITKEGRTVDGSPGVGQMLFAYGKENVAALVRSQSDPRLKGCIMAYKKVYTNGADK